MGAFKVVARERAINGGIDFICRLARSRRTFRALAPYFVSSFLLIASTSRDRRLRRVAREAGRNLAVQWRRLSPLLPRKADVNVIFGFVIAGCGAEYFGLRHKVLKEQVQSAAKRFAAADFLGFDPTIEPPPNDLPETCRCGRDNPRGRKKCHKCKRRLIMNNRYHMWTEALSATYWAERYGITLQARYADVLKWLPNMRPYPRPKEADYEEFYHILYAVTHVVYTLNGYGRYNLSTQWLPAEFLFLKASMNVALDRRDPDMVGELLDSLKAFGLTDNDPTIRRGLNYLLSQQNEDGSWGDPNADDAYERYHTTWAAIDGLRDFAWRGTRLSLPRLHPILKRFGNSE